MQFSVELPDELATQLIPEGRDPARKALEDIAIEAYRSHRLTEHQLATLLDIDRYSLDRLLKQRGVWLDYSMDELRRDLEAHRELGL